MLMPHYSELLDGPTIRWPRQSFRSPRQSLSLFTEVGVKAICSKGNRLDLCLLIQISKPRTTKLNSLAGSLCEKDGFIYVAQKLSNLSATDGKEKSRGHGSVLVR
jgi:hypothetical protein